MRKNKSHKARMGCIIFILIVFMACSDENKEIQIIYSIEQTNIITSGFDIKWKTAFKGTSNLKYGITRSLELGEINQERKTKLHSISLSGLKQAEFYYVQAYSVYGYDTAFSNIGLYSTASNSTGKIRIYFNKPVDNSISTGVDAVYLDHTFADTIMAYIDKAKSTLDVCMFVSEVESIVQSINRAYVRGVTVRFITSGDGQTNTALKHLNDKIPLLKGSPKQSMHNKFFIIDAKSTSHAWVITSSANNTERGLNDWPNNMVLIQDEALAKAYTWEFEEMWGGSGTMPDSSNAKFGAQKTDNTPHRFIIDGKLIELYFSPSDFTNSAIVNAIKTSDCDLEFALAIFQVHKIAVEVKNAHKRGVNVRGIIELIKSTSSEYHYLRNNGANVLEHTLPETMHQKYVIIDATLPDSDPMVITGSYNWYPVNTANIDDNTLIIHDAFIANIYLQEFSARFKELPEYFKIRDIEQTKIKTTGFDIKWTTNFNSTSNIKYGLTRSLELGEIKSIEQTTSHTVSLNSLASAEFYYIQVYSVYGDDTIFSKVGLYSTASNSTGKIRIYFNKPVDNSISTGVDAVYLDHTFADTIMAYIDKAKSTLDVCMFVSEVESIVQSINRAYVRGVTVRFITSGDGQTNTALKHLNDKIPLLKGSPKQSMHNKFFIIDAKSTNNAWVITSSANNTDRGLNDWPNNMVLIQDKALAKAYTWEFEEMWGGSGTIPDSSNAKFGAQKTDNTPHKFIVNNKLVELYFNPSDRTNRAIIKTIYTANQDLEFAMAQFWGHDLGTAIKNVHNNDVNVKGIVDVVKYSTSEDHYLRNLGINILSHTLPAVMHHKYAIIDANAPDSDPIVITGSYNWHLNNIKIDDNTLIIHDPSIANIYLQEFTARYNDVLKYNFTH
ncbi:MAG: hypothetical protein FVQ77_09405 [Cytophagales bacterium]|nr:hypothetical protein [Cytophagales bacterium]